MKHKTIDVIDDIEQLVYHMGCIDTGGVHIGDAFEIDDYDQIEPVKMSRIDKGGLEYWWNKHSGLLDKLFTSFG